MWCLLDRIIGRHHHGNTLYKIYRGWQKQLHAKATHFHILVTIITYVTLGQIIFITSFMNSIIHFTKVHQTAVVRKYCLATELIVNVMRFHCSFSQSRYSFFSSDVLLIDIFFFKGNRYSFYLLKKMYISITYSVLDMSECSMVSL